jgi:hypothetical protein
MSAIHSYEIKYFQKEKGKAHQPRNPHIKGTLSAAQIIIIPADEFLSLPHRTKYKM